MTTFRTLLAGLLLVPLLSLAGAQSAPPVALLIGHSQEAASVLDHTYIFVESDGTLDIEFDKALGVFNQPNVLGAAQTAYEAMLPQGEASEFKIEPNGNNRWFYINRKQQRSDVKELHRQAPSPDALDLVYFASGERFFGDFRSLVHIHASRAPDGTVGYEADVYAYPDNGVVRFFVRHLNLVERFFNDKTASMAVLITDIAYYLCNERDTAQRSLSGSASQAL